jgi:hypothetical protein
VAGFSGPVQALGSAFHTSVLGVAGAADGSVWAAYTDRARRPRAARPHGSRADHRPSDELLEMRTAEFHMLLDRSKETDDFLCLRGTDSMTPTFHGVSKPKLSAFRRAN